MATRRAKGISRLDEEPYAGKIRETNQLVNRLLAAYGEPTMSLGELRKLVEEQLPDTNLSDVILQEREAGW